MTAISPAARQTRHLVIVLGLTTSFVFVESAGAYFTGSLALVANAGHMLTDVAGLSLAIFAIWLGQRPATPEKTYGYYRGEILAALANSVVLLLVSGFIFYEAYSRFKAPPEVRTVPMILVAGVGLIVNLAGIWLLHREAEESLNVHGAFLEVVSDALGSLGVIVAGLIMFVTGFFLVDTIFSVLIGLFILPRTWGLLNRALHVLLEGTPSHISLAEMRQEMLALKGVRDVHDLHVWSITSGFEAMSGHVRLDGQVDGHQLLENLRQLLRERFSIEHVTIQLEEEEMAEPHIHE
ncbi:MAG: cation diffusion facilitator family transporter [Chloroflexi bacterium]|nr:cation diffusion facilitator family transporter [Chloroflexota bacterium]MDA8189034.1 cation diffusion facilitator family transporter [Dehalococcoidales bacterium]